MKHSTLRTPPSPAVRRRHHFGYRANLFMLRIGGIFLPLAYALVYVVTIFFWFIDAQSRRASMNFLDRVLGPRNYLTRRLQSWRHFFTYGQLLLDRSVALAEPSGAFKCRCPNRDNLLKAMQDDRALLILTAHFGAAELAAPMLTDLPNSRPFHFVVYRDMRDTTEHFHQDQWRALAHIRFINSMDPISAGVKIMAALQAHEFVALRADRAMSGRTLATQLLGATVELPAGPFMAAVLTQANVVSAFTVRRGWRRYDLLVSAPRQYSVAAGENRADVLKIAAADFASDLEAAVKQYPYQWGNFFDLWLSPSARQAPPNGEPPSDAPVKSPPGLPTT